MLCVTVISEGDDHIAQGRVYSSGDSNKKDTVLKTIIFHH